MKKVPLCVKMGTSWEKDECMRYVLCDAMGKTSGGAT